MNLWICITRKLVLLLALGSGQRVQTLTAIRVSQTSIYPNKLIICIPDRVKTSAPGHTQPVFTFSRFFERPKLCIVSLLEHYLHITKNLRVHNCNYLFISCVKPHRAITVQTMSRWIRKGLEEYGIQRNSSQLTALDMHPHR